ncbi:MAG TPA: amino acid adenylation domain-containing protein, partial [Pyrinomonadaceae bacterium]|nr:amino acid adenylation domain-containing protein [Pyrinomonadaceae bacterium]
GWPAWWQYDAGAVGEGAARRLAGQYARLVEAATADPARELGELELFGEEDERLLREWNETEADYPRLCVHELIEEQVKRTPDAVAVEFEGELLTYAELDARANQLARHLRGLGVGPDALVAVMLERSAGLIVSLLAVLKAGGAYVPLDPEYPAERLAFMLADSGARVLITQSKLASSLPEHGARVVALDAEREEIALHNADTLPGWAAADNLAYVIYTSGSTGRPKGVAIEHRQLVNYVSGVTERLGLASVKGFALISTFAADLGNTVLFPSLCGGGCLHLLSAETATDPDLLSDYFSRHAVDCLKIVPSHLAALQGSRPERILPRQKLILGGEASGWQWVETLRRAAPACEVFNHYGPTETTVGVLTYGAAEGSRGGAALLPLGRPLPNTRVYILDEKMRAVPVGVRGELYVGGAQVGRGYLGRPALTAERFVPDPFSGETGSRLYRTGDLARYLDDGVLEFLGRADDQIKVRGYRIEPGEIEAALLGHVAVRECVVLAREGAGGERRLVAYVVAEEGAALDAAELREYARGRLPQHMVPGWVVRLGRFPLTPNGKVDRRALPEPDGERPESGTPYEAPRDGVEQTLADIWGEALGVEKVGVRDSFFSLGGDSILSVRVVALAKERGLRFTIQELFRHQTIAELAAHVAAPAAGASAPEGGGAADEELARLLEEVGQLSDEEVFLRLNGGAQTSGAGETQ